MKKAAHIRQLKEVASALEQEGIETDIFWIGTKAIAAVLPVTGCAKTAAAFFMTRSMNFWSCTCL